MEFPIDFKECPNCGKEGTLSLQALDDEPVKPLNPIAMLEKEVTPIQDFLRISTPNTKVLLKYYDICASCGLKYCVRAEKGTIPTEILMQMMGVSQQMPKRR